MSLNALFDQLYESLFDRLILGDLCVGTLYLILLRRFPGVLKEHKGVPQILRK